MIICKVCGGKVADEVACCARCFTPHHYDCWSFTGACSIYGCGCKEHRYYDFREKGEVEVLAAISQSLALAIRSEAAGSGHRPGTAPGTGAGGGGAGAGGPWGGPGSAGAVGADRWPGSAGVSMDEILTHKRNMFRSIQAVLQKVAPDRAAGDDDVVQSLAAEVSGGRDMPELFLADDLVIDEPAPGASDPLDEKRKLLHSLARSAHLPERTGVGGMIRELLDWLRGLFGRRR